jgi:hypothetical protein
MEKKQKITPTVGTIPKWNIKIAERGKIDIPNTQIHDHSLSCHDTKNEWQHKHGEYNSRVNECSKLTADY